MYKLSALLLILAAILVLGVPATNARPVKEGKDYVLVVPPVAVEVPEGKVEVREFFWYGCPHCYAIEPALNSWKKPPEVIFIRTPAVLGRQWVVHGYTYYTLKELKRLDELHPILFDALHNKNLNLSTPGRLAAFFEGHGISKDKFKEVFESMVVNAQIKKADRLVKKYRIDGVPTFAVNGKYLTSPSMAGNMQHFMRVLKHLVSLETAAE